MFMRSLLNFYPLILFAKLELKFHKMCLQPEDESEVIQTLNKGSLAINYALKHISIDYLLPWGE